MLRASLWQRPVQRHLVKHRLLLIGIHQRFLGFVIVRIRVHGLLSIRNVGVHIPQIAAPIQLFDVHSVKAGGTAHRHDGVESVQLTFTGPTTAWPDFVRCIQALASVFDTLSTAPLDRQKVREHFFKRKK